MFNLFRKKRVTLDIYSASDFSRIPQGFFVCVSEAGRRTVGHTGPAGLVWAVQNPSLTTEQLAALPLVRLHLGARQPGVMHVGGRALVSTDLVDGFDGEFLWDVEAGKL